MGAMCFNNVFCAMLVGSVTFPEWWESIIGNSNSSKFCCIFDYYFSETKVIFRRNKMIKVEDTISRVIICFLIVLFLFYGFMFIDNEPVLAFAKNWNKPSDVMMQTYSADANLGWVYIVFAVGFTACLLAPIEQSTVFFRMMLVGSFVTSIRQIVLIMGEDGGANPVPMVASILVFMSDEYLVRQGRSENPFNMLTF